jgi:hypothetical protein
VVYARTLGKHTYTFQVSGRLWRNGLVMIDRESETSWSQITGRAIDGKHRGAQLVKLEAIQTTWRQWWTAHPDTLVLKKGEEVLGSHYQQYFDDPEKTGLFRAQWLTDRMPGKTLVYGATIGAHAVAVTDEAFADGNQPRARLGDVQVVFNRGADGGVRAWVDRVDGPEIVAVTPVYWFAWSSFYPNTQVVD